MINKIFDSLSSAVKDVQDGATVMIGGFGTAGMPSELIDALIEQGARELTIVNNNAGNGETGLAALLNTGSTVGAFANVLPTGSLLPHPMGHRDRH